MTEFGGKSRKSLRIFARKIAKKGVGKEFGFDEQDSYFQRNLVEAGVCPCLRHPRSNKRGFPDRVFGLCFHSPYGRISMKTASDDLVKDPIRTYHMGVCQKSLPIDPSFKCPYEIESLAKLKLKRIKGIKGVEFSDGMIEGGVSAYARWGESHIKLKAYMGLSGINTIRGINVLGTLEDISVVGNGLDERIIPIPIRKRRNVKSLIFGMEDLFLKEMLNCLIIKKGQGDAFYDKGDFRNRIHIASS